MSINKHYDKTSSYFIEGTEILMYDGSSKNIEDIKIGEFVMGSDSEPRLVEKLDNKYDYCFEVIPNKGDTFLISRDSVLPLKSTNRTKEQRKKELYNHISIENYIKTNKTFKHMNKLYRSNLEFSDKNLLLDPYLLGLILGDGNVTHNRVNVCTPDEEIVSEINKYGIKYSLFVTKYNKKDNLASSYSFVTKKGSGGKTSVKDNYILESIKNIGLYDKRSGDKFIPNAYKYSSTNQRLELLAGLIDTDGSLQGNYEYSTKSPYLKDDVLFLCRSLGLAAYASEKYVNGTVYHRISISGEISKVPTRVIRKQAPPRKRNSNVLVTGFKIEERDKNNLFSIKLDDNKDKLILLNNLTVIHSS